MEKEKVLVVFGGKSAEHDISIITGLQTLKNIDREKYDVFPLYISRAGEMFFGRKLEEFESYINFNRKKFKKATFCPGSKFLYLQIGTMFVKKFEVSCAVVCCHGLNGEDGTLQGLFELCEIPQTSCNAMSSSICMDKIVMKDVLRANGIKTPKSVFINKTDFFLNEKSVLDKIEKELDLFENSCFVKPANLGSSIGISKCHSRDELAEAIDIAGGYDERIIVEQAVEGATEVNCAVLGNSDYQTISSLEYPKSWSSFLSFDEKYIARKEASENKEIKTKKLSSKTEKQIQEISRKAFNVFDCSGVVRIDFLVGKDGDIYLNELNSIPGSLAFYLFKEQGIDFKKLISKLIDLAKRKQRDKLKNKFSYQSNALENFGRGNKGNKYSQK